MMYAVGVGPGEDGNNMETVMKSRFMWIALAATMLATLGAGCGGGDDDASSTKGQEKEPEKIEGTVCGSKICEDEVYEGFEGELCCRSAFDGICGQTVGGTCLDLPKPPDERCENGMFMAMGQTISVNSCCTDGGECGLRFEFGGQANCTSLTQAMSFGRQMVMGGNMMVNVMGTLPEPKNCDGSPVEAPAAGSGG